MITLAIETSCDETAICILETKAIAASENLEYRILANLIHSQVALHRQYGGVFPIMAKREHAKNLIPLLEVALAQAKIKLSPANSATTAEKITEIKKILQEKESDLLEHLLASPLVDKKPASTIDRIAVTRGPGLEPALWVGVNAARALGILWDIPVVGVNHMEGHVVGSLLGSSEVWNGIDGSPSDFKKFLSIAYPALALLISGGHTELVLVKYVGGHDGSDKNKYIYEIIGRTKDDAIGEAFDKVARLLGLPYPGGPEISKLASAERETERKAKQVKNVDDNTKKSKRTIILPRPMIHSPDLDFSFSGLKTAVLYLTRELRKKNAGSDSKIDGELTAKEKSLIAREFEDAVTDVLVAKTKKAIEHYGAVALIVGGGVIANSHIAQALTRLATEHDIPMYMPPAGVSGDNALMIALVGALSTPTALPRAISVTQNTLTADGNLSF
jgi:N6-L-threonylcarbamoyladenine synthase